jgi:hypothetical protein
MEEQRTHLTNIAAVSDPSRNSDALVGSSLHPTRNGVSNISQPYLDSDSDSDVDENDTPPTIIKRKSEIPRYLTLGILLLKTL